MPTDFGGRTIGRQGPKQQTDHTKHAPSPFTSRENQNRTERALTADESPEPPGGGMFGGAVRPAPFTVDTTAKVNGGGSLVRGHQRGDGGRGGKHAGPGPKGNPR